MMSLIVVSLLAFPPAQAGVHGAFGPMVENFFPGYTAAADTFFVDIESSLIHWKGTKFRGLGKHEGSIWLSSGYFLVEDETIVSGHFEIDMTSIAVTDMPAHEFVPRTRLLRHLASEDFFFVDRYPVSTFVLSESAHITRDDISACGVLTMRGISHPVAFEAAASAVEDGGMEVRASIQINRHDWGVAYRGSRLTNDLVDDTIYLELRLRAEKQGRD